MFSTIFCVVSSLASANSLVTALKQADFADNDISVVAALSGIAVGATVGGISRSLIGMGIPESEARRYEAKVNDGSILLSVSAKDGDRLKRAIAIFEDGDATDILTAEATASTATAPSEKPRLRSNHDESTTRGAVIGFI